MTKTSITVHYFAISIDRISEQDEETEEQCKEELGALATDLNE